MASQGVFQHTAARRRLDNSSFLCCHWCSFNTQPPEGGWRWRAGIIKTFACFNTQPPEGGWRWRAGIIKTFACFNTQPPEGGWAADGAGVFKSVVSTHSRPKAAGTLPL